MGIEDSPFLPFCEKWKGLGERNRQKYKSTDWESLQPGLQGTAPLPRLPPLEKGPHASSQHPFSSSLPDASSLHLSTFADKYRRFIPPENLEHVLAAAKVVERSVVLPPLPSNPLADPDHFKEFNSKVAHLPLRRPFEADAKDRGGKDGSKRQRVGEGRDTRGHSTSPIRSGKGKAKASEDDRVLSYLLGPPLDKALTALASAEAKASSTQSLLRVEALEVEMEECLEMVAEQERVRMENLQAEHNQRKHEQRLRELSRVRVDSLGNSSTHSTHSASRPASVSVHGPQTSMWSDHAAAASALDHHEHRPGQQSLASPRQGPQASAGSGLSRQGTSKGGARTLPLVPEVEADTPKDVLDVEAGVPKVVHAVEADTCKNAHMVEAVEPEDAHKVEADALTGVPKKEAGAPMDVPKMEADELQHAQKGEADVPQKVPEAEAPKAAHEGNSGPQDVLPGGDLLQPAPAAGLPWTPPSDEGPRLGPSQQEEHMVHQDEHPHQQQQQQQQHKQDDQHYQQHQNKDALEEDEHQLQVQQQQQQQQEEKEHGKAAQAMKQGSFKRNVSYREPPSDTEVQAPLPDEEKQLSGGGSASQRMQRYLRRSTSSVHPALVSRRASFAGNLLGSAEGSRSSVTPRAGQPTVPKGGLEDDCRGSPPPRQSESGLSFVLQPKLAKQPSVAACRRLAKRHTWFGMGEEKADKKEPSLLAEGDNEGRPSSAASSDASGLEINAPRSFHETSGASFAVSNSLDGGRSSRSTSIHGSHPPEHKEEDVVAAARSNPASTADPPSQEAPSLPQKVWPRLKPRVSVVASVLAAGAALGVPSLMESPSGPPDVAAVAVLWAAWAREPENTKSPLMLSGHKAEGAGAVAGPQPGQKNSKQPAVESAGQKPFIQLAAHERVDVPVRFAASLGLPPSHQLLCKLLQPHPRRSARRCGVSLSFLVTLGGLLVAELGPQQAWRLTTQDVSEWLLLPLVHERHCSVATLLPDEAVGVPQHAVSHSYACPFLNMVNALIGHFSTDNMAETFLWVDFLSRNFSAPGAQSPAKQVAAVREAIRSTHSTLLILDSEGRALSRTWVLFEAWCSCIPFVPSVTDPSTAAPPADPPAPGAPKLVLLLPHGTPPNPMLAKALKTACVTRAEATSSMDYEVMLDHMRKVSLSLSAYRAKMELQQLPEYKRQAKEFSRKDVGPAAGPEAIDPLVQADMLIQSGLAQCVQMEASEWRNVLDDTDKLPALELSAALRRSNQLGALLVSLFKSAEATRLLSRAVILTIDGRPADLCVSDLVYAVSVLVAVLLEQGRVRSAVVISRKVYEALIRLLHRHPCVPSAAFALITSLSKGLQHPSAEIIAHTTLRRLELMHSQMHPHLQHLHHVSSRPASSASAASGLHGDSPHALKGGALGGRLRDHNRTSQNGRTSQSGTKERVGAVSFPSIPAGASDSGSAEESSHSLAAFGSQAEDVADGSFATITTPGGLPWWWGHFGAASSTWGQKEVDHGGFHGVKGELRNDSDGLGACDDGRRYCVRVDFAQAAWALGTALKAQQRWAEADTVLQQAAVLLQSALGSRHPYVGLVLVALGEVAAANKDHLEATSCFTQARPLLLCAYTRDTPTWIHTTVLFAASLQAMGDLDTAENMMRRLLRPPVSMQKLYNAKNAPAAASLPSNQQQGKEASAAAAGDEGHGHSLDGMSARAPGGTGGEDPQAPLPKSRTSNGGNRSASGKGADVQDEDEENAPGMSPQIQELLVNEDEKALDARLSGQSYQVLSQLAKILIMRAVTLPPHDPDDAIGSLEERPRVLGRGPVLWMGQEKAYIRIPKARLLNIFEVKAEVKAAMDKRARGQHFQLDVGEDIAQEAGKESAHNQGEASQPTTARPTLLSKIGAVPQSLKGRKAFNTSKVEVTMMEAVKITARLLSRLQEAIKSSRQTAEAGAVARLRAIQNRGGEGAADAQHQGGESVPDARHQLRGPKTMTAHDYAARLKGARGRPSMAGSEGGPKSSRVKLPTLRRKSHAGSRARSRRVSMVGVPTSVREEHNDWAELDGRQGSKAQGFDTERSIADAGKGPRSTKREDQSDRQQKKQAGRPAMPVEQDRVGDIKKAGAEGDKLLGRLSHESLQPSSKPGSPSEQSVKLLPSVAPEGAVPPLKIPPKQAPSCFANAKRPSSASLGGKRPPSAFHTSRHKAPPPTKDEHKEDHKPSMQEENRKAMADIPAAIATAAGLAAEGAERQAWKLSALQIADTYLAHVSELHLGAEMGAVIMALQAAVSIYEALGGFGSSEFMDASVFLFDAMFCSRMFVEARQILVNYEKSVNASASEKVFLQQRVKERATEHLFRAVTLGDEELAFWALELGARPLKPMPLHALGDSLLMPMANALVLAISKRHCTATATVTSMVPHVVEEEDGETGMHPLSMAASLGDVELTNMMLENKAHVDAVDRCGRTALMHASVHGHERVIMAIIPYHPSLNMKDAKSGMTALMLAASQGHAKATKVLLDGLAGTGMLDHRNRTALIWAAIGGHVAVLNHLLFKGGTRSNAKDEDGMSALCHACREGHLDCVKLLVDNKADLKTSDSHKQTPLHKAAIVQNPSVLCLLLLERPDVSIRDAQGRNVLHLAAQENNSIHCAMLIYYIARNYEMSSNSKPLVVLPHLQLPVGGNVDGVSMKIGNKVDSTLNGRKLVDRKNTSMMGPEQQLLHLAINESLRLKQADEELQARRLQEAAAAQMLQDEMYGGDMRTLSQGLASPPVPSLLRDTQQPPQQASSRQQLQPTLPGTPIKAAAEDPKEATVHQAGRVRSSGDGHQGQQAQHKGTVGVEATRSEAQRADQNSNKSTGDRQRASSAMSSVRSATGTPKEGVRVRLPSEHPSRASTPASGESGVNETPVKEEPPFNLELLLPYASLTQVRHFVSATDKYGCTPVDLAAASGHIHLAQLLNQFLVNKA